MLEETDPNDVAMAAKNWHAANYRGGDGQLEAARQYIRALEMRVFQMTFAASAASRALPGMMGSLSAAKRGEP